MRAAQVDELAPGQGKLVQRVMVYIVKAEGSDIFIEVA
jgi:hypothetical protein